LEAKGEKVFGMIAKKLGYLSKEQIRECVEEQRRRMRSGENVRLGEVCVEKGYLTVQEVNEILQEQQRSVLVCPGCGTPYSIEGFPVGKRWRCKVCGSMLEVPGATAQAEATAGGMFGDASSDGDAGPGVITAIYEERLAEGRVPDEKEFGNYEIIEKVAQGGMGIIYKARQKGLDRIVALKVLLGGDAASEEMISRFYLEAKSIARLRHPNIVPIHDIGEFEGKHYFTMDFIHGQSLRALLNEKGRLPVPFALEMARKVAEAIHYAHEQGVVHRDIKPENILIDETGEPMITDFGLAKNVEIDPNLTRAGMVMGTPAYMAPEQARGERDRVDRTSDVYSIGAVLYEMLAGRPVYKFFGQVGLADLLRVIQKDITQPRRWNPAVPKDVDTIVMKALEKEQERRYQTAKELADDIQRYMRGEAILARPPSITYRTWKKFRKYWYITAPTTAAVIAVVAIVAYFISLRLEERARKQELIGEALKAATQAVEQASVLLRKKDFDGVKKLLRTADENVSYVLRENVHHVKANKLKWESERLGRQLESRRAVEEVRARARKAMEEGRRMVEEGMELIKEGKKWDGILRIYAAKGKFDRALADWRDFAAARRAKYEACMRLGGLFAGRRDYGTAILMYTDALGMGVDDESVRKALDEARRAKEYMEQFETVKKRADEAFGEGRFDEAVMLYEQAMKFKGMTPEERASLQRSMKKAQYQKHFVRGEQLLREGKSDAAAEEFRAAARHVETEDVRERLRTIEYRHLMTEARQAEARGEYLEALKHYEDARGFASTPDDVETAVEQCRDKAFRLHSEKFRMAFGQGEWDVALKEADAALVFRDSGELRQRRRELIWAKRPPEGMVAVFSGVYEVGSHLKDDRNPQRRMPVAFFYIDRYEVTNHQYQKFVDAGGYADATLWDAGAVPHLKEFVDASGKPGPATWKNGKYPEGTGDFPVTGVCWYEARAYARWADKRLPTEEEWEVAAGWDPARKRRNAYPWGDVWNADAGNFKGTRPVAVGTRPLDKSALGCFDMGGNAFEWTDTAYKEEFRVVKGGSFGLSEDSLVRFARNTKRKCPEPLYRSPNVGFRCAVSP